MTDDFTFDDGALDTDPSRFYRYAAYALMCECSARDYAISQPRMVMVDESRQWFFEAVCPHCFEQRSIIVID